MLQFCYLYLQKLVFIQKNIFYLNVKTSLFFSYKTTMAEICSSIDSSLRCDNYGLKTVEYKNSKMFLGIFWSKVFTSRYIIGENKELLYTPWFKKCLLSSSEKSCFFKFFSTMNQINKIPLNNVYLNDLNRLDLSYWDVYDKSIVSASFKQRFSKLQLSFLYNLPVDGFPKKFIDPSWKSKFLFSKVAKSSEDSLDSENADLEDLDIPEELADEFNDAVVNYKRRLYSYTFKEYADISYYTIVNNLYSNYLFFKFENNFLLISKNKKLNLDFNKGLSLLNYLEFSFQEMRRPATISYYMNFTSHLYARGKNLNSAFFLGTNKVLEISILQILKNNNDFSLLSFFFYLDKKSVLSCFPCFYKRIFYLKHAYKFLFFFNYNFFIMDEVSFFFKK